MESNQWGWGPPQEAPTPPSPLTGDDIGTVLRKARERAQLTQQQLADRAQTAQAVVCAIEKGTRDPSFRMVRRLLDALDLQLFLHVETTTQRIDALIASASTLSVDQVFADREQCRFDGGFDLAQLVDSLAGIEFRLCGRTAAALLGAPVPVGECELMLRDDPDTEMAFGRWISTTMAMRWPSSAHDPGGPLTTATDAPAERWQSLYGFITVRYLNRLPSTVWVTFQERALPVVPMSEIETDDPLAARILERIRQRAREAG